MSKRFLKYAVSMCAGPAAQIYYLMKKRKLPIVLLYHEVSDNVLQHFEYLHDSRFIVRDIEKVLLPCERSVIITFDDGYKEIFTRAFPVFKKYGFTATVFLSTDYVGRPCYLSWGEIKEMTDYGISFQSHGLTHTSLTALSPEEARKELKDSRRILRERIGKQIDYFAYPYGDSSRIVREILEQEGYRGGFTNISGFNYERTDPYYLKRIEIYPDDTIRDFRQKLKGYQNWLAAKQWL